MSHLARLVARRLPRLPSSAVVRSTIVRSTVVFLGMVLVGASAEASGDSWSGGWDWDGFYTATQFVASNWRPAAKDWALDLAEGSLTDAQLVDAYYPPPREPWCGSGPSPSVADCRNFRLSLNDWTHDFLDISDAEPLPAGLPSFPKACISSCIAM